MNPLESPHKSWRAAKIPAYLFGLGSPARLLPPYRPDCRADTVNSMAGTAPNLVPRSRQSQLQTLSSGSSTPPRPPWRHASAACLRRSRIGRDQRLLAGTARAPVAQRKAVSIVEDLLNL
jgi:hypothetical protein